jgi:hypothetical protein
MPLTPVAITICRGCSVPVSPSVRRNNRRPAGFGLVVGAALERCARPEVQLHALDIGIEPVGEFVLRDIDRPVRRERHVGQVIDLHLIMQRQRVVALAPVVADPGLPIDDQRIDPQLLQPRRDRKPGLAAADHQHIGIAIGILNRGLTLIEPVGASEIPRVGLAARPRNSLLLLISFQFIECRQQRPGLQPVTVAGIRDQPQNPAAASDGSFEFENRFDGAAARARDVARRRAVRINSEILWRRGPGAGLQFFQDGIGAVDRLQGPAQRQHVAPKTVGMKQGAQRAAIGPGDCAFEMRQPACRGHRNVVGFVQLATS